MMPIVMPHAAIVKGYCPPKPYFSAQWSCAATNRCATSHRRNIHTRRSLDGGAGFDAHRRIAVGGERRQDFRGMGGVARLDRHVELGAFGRHVEEQPAVIDLQDVGAERAEPVSYTHLRAHETVLDLVCRL